MPTDQPYTVPTDPPTNLPNTTYLPTCPSTYPPTRTSTYTLPLTHPPTLPHTHCHSYTQGYNTENWTIGDSKIEKKERKKTQSRRSLIKTVYRDTSDEKTDTNSWGPPEIKSVSREPGGVYKLFIFLFISDHPVDNLRVLLPRPTCLPTDRPIYQPNHHPFIYQPTYLLTHLPTNQPYLPTHPPTNPPTLILPTYRPTYPCIHLPTRTSTYTFPLPHSPTHPPTHPPTHSMTHCHSLYTQGNNTDDWTIGDSEIEKKSRRKTLERTINNGSKQLSQSRRSLIKKVYRDTSEEKTDRNSSGPSEIKSVSTSGWMEGRKL